MSSMKNFCKQYKTISFGIKEIKGGYLSFTVSQNKNKIRLERLFLRISLISQFGLIQDEGWYLYNSQRDPVPLFLYRY